MRALFFAASLLIALGSVAAADGPVNVAATVDKRGITIGDPITLALVVEVDAGYKITDSGVGGRWMSPRARGDTAAGDGIKTADAYSSLRSRRSESRLVFGDPVA